MSSFAIDAYPFIEGQQSQRPEPLDRYLPPVANGIIASWLSNNIPPGSWVLDPFGASPKIALEAARSGYKVLVAVNNPITRFTLEILANPPSAEDLTTALAALASLYIGDERIEPHIRALYNTTCASCGQIITASAFLWLHENPSPYMRIYTCPNCGDTGEHPSTASDVENSNRFSSSGLHKARALERVIASSDQDRDHVEQALGVYIPRALYALVTIINKFDGIQLSPSAKRALSALLLYAFDQGNAMWKVAGQKEKPRQLSIPRSFRENNIWMALEEGITLWSAQRENANITLTRWPDLPQSLSGICIYEGRYSSIAGELKELDIQAVCTALPRPNQAYWTLSALWAGWLWGREAIAHYKSVLHRQRYDWAWHTSALLSVFTHLVASLKLSTPVFGLISDVESGFIGSSLISAALAGLQLENLAFRQEQGQAQVLWKTFYVPQTHLTGSAITHSAIQSGTSYLQKRAEPASYLLTFSAALSGVIEHWESQSKDKTDTRSAEIIKTANSAYAPESSEQSPSALYALIYNTTRDVLTYRCGFLQYGFQTTMSLDFAEKTKVIQNALFSIEPEPVDDEQSEQTTEEIGHQENQSTPDKSKPARSSEISASTAFWLRDSASVQDMPITDKYELQLYNNLLNNPGITVPEVDTQLRDGFPGLFTPPLEFIHICLESYTNISPENKGALNLRVEDDSVERHKDIQQSEKILFDLAKHLGFSSRYLVSPQSLRYIYWQDEKANTSYQFYITASAAISNMVLYGEQPSTKAYIIIPGSRANIIFYKLRHDPRLGRAFLHSAGNWRFIKFRHLRSLSSSSNLSRENLEQLLNLDPLTYSAPQLWLI